MRRLSRSFAVLTVLCFPGAVGVAYSTSEGISWHAPRLIASGGGERGPWRQNDSTYDYVDDPTVALDSRGVAAVAWVDQRVKDVLVQVLDAKGAAQLVAPVNVSRSPATFSWLPRMVLSSKNPDHLYVLWQEIVFSGGSHGGEIYFARSSDGGRSFDLPLNLSRSKGGDGKGRINRELWHNGSLDIAMAPDGTLYAAWTEYDGPLWLSRSGDGGSTFSRPALIAGGGNSKPARAPALAVGPDDVVYLAWTTGENDRADIRVARSADGGRTFAEPAVVERTVSYSDAPKIAVDARGIVHVTYAESAGGPFDGYHIRYARSRDNGRSFERGRDISRPHPDGIRSAAFPGLALGGQGQVYVLAEAYAGRRGSPRGLLMMYSPDAGERFMSSTIVPGGNDPGGGVNGSQQGLLMRKLAANAVGKLAVVNSSLEAGRASRVWLTRGELRQR